MRHARLTIVEGETEMFDCVKHGKVAKSISGFCVDCCSEDHICETCGLRSGSDDGFTLVEWRSTQMWKGQMLCDDCVACADCEVSGDDRVNSSNDYDELLCDSCVEDRDEEWDREEKEREERSDSTQA